MRGQDDVQDRMQNNEGPHLPENTVKVASKGGRDPATATVNANPSNLQTTTPATCAEQPGHPQPTGP